MKPFFSLFLLYCLIIPRSLLADNQFGEKVYYSLGVDDLTLTVLHTEKDEVLGELAMVRVNEVCFVRPRLLMKNKNGKALTEPVIFSIPNDVLQSLRSVSKPEFVAQCDAMSNGSLSIDELVFRIDSIFTGQPAEIYTAVFKENIK